MIDYSQSGEQETILALRTASTWRRFLDIGAGDGETFSNTRALREVGWSGVCVEPAAALFDRLVALYGSDETVTCVSAVVVADAGGRLTDFYYAGDDLLSTTEADAAAIWPTVPFVKVQAATVSLDHVLDTLGAFTFVSLDTEGTSLDLLDAYRQHDYWAFLEGVCVEVASEEEARRAEATAGDGWRLVQRTSNNAILARA